MELIFAKSSKIFSKVIRIVTRSNWSHVGLLHEGWVYESVGQWGVVKTTLKDFCSRYDRVEVRDIEVADPEKAIKKAESLLGKRYDTGGVLGYAFGKNWSNPEYFQCAEFVDECLEIITPEKRWKADPEFFCMISRGKTK